MKLDEVSKEIIKTFNFDDVLNPDLTDDEKIFYYEQMLEDAKANKDKKAEDEIAKIIKDLLDEGDINE